MIDHILREVLLLFDALNAFYGLHILFSAAQNNILVLDIYGDRNGPR